MRWVSFTDRYGAEEDDDITLGRLAELLATIAMYDGDDEHRSISVSDSTRESRFPRREQRGCGGAAVAELS